MSDASLYGHREVELLLDELRTGAQVENREAEVRARQDIPSLDPEVHGDTRRLLGGDDLAKVLEAKSDADLIAPRECVVRGERQVRVGEVGSLISQLIPSRQVIGPDTVERDAPRVPPLLVSEASKLIPHGLERLVVRQFEVRARNEGHRTRIPVVGRRIRHVRDYGVAQGDRARAGADSEPIEPRAGVNRLGRDGKRSEGHRGQDERRTGGFHLSPSALDGRSSGASSEW